MQTIAATVFTMLTFMSTFDYILRCEPEEVFADPNAQMTIEYFKFRSWIGQELMAVVADVCGVIFLIFIRVAICSNETFYEQCKGEGLTDFLEDVLQQSILYLSAFASVPTFCYSYIFMTNVFRD